MIFSGKKNTDTDTTVVGLIVSALRRDISFGTLEPDKRLKIEALRAKYGGSSHSMREALTVLSTEGLVEANAQRGFRVSSATSDDLKDIGRLRSEIEQLGLQWSMEEADVSWEAQIIAAHHKLTRAVKDVQTSAAEYALAWDEAERAFHLALVSGSGSPRLITIHTRLYDQYRRFRLAALMEGRIAFSKETKQQKQLIDAIIDHQPDKAASLLQLLIENTLPT